MAKDPAEPQDAAGAADPADTGADAAATEGEKEKVERKPSKFNILVHRKGESVWTPIPTQYESITQDEAKRNAARDLAADNSEYQPDILGDGLELVAVSARGWKPIVVKVEPQPAKLVLS